MIDGAQATRGAYQVSRPDVGLITRRRSNVVPFGTSLVMSSASSGGARPASVLTPRRFKPGRSDLTMTLPPKYRDATESDSSTGTPRVLSTGDAVLVLPPADAGDADRASDGLQTRRWP